MPISSPLPCPGNKHGEKNVSGVSGKVSEKKRDLSIDVAKGIGILLVIVGHCGVGTVSIFHMPFFFIMSGLFLSAKLSVRDFTKNRARRVLVPYVYGVCLTIIGAVALDLLRGEAANIGADVLKWLAAGLYGRGAKGNILIPGVVKIGALWFLLATFYGTVIVRRFLGSKYLLPITALIAYVGVATKEVLFLPFSLQNGMVASFFIAVGVYVKRYDVLHKKPDVFIMGGCIGLTLFAVANSITLSMVNLNFNYGLLNLAVAFATSYIVLKFSQVLGEKTRILRSFLAFCGTNSLIILCYHAVEINLLHWGWVSRILLGLGIEQGKIVTLALIVVRIIFCLVCTVVTLNIKPLKKIFS